MPAPRSVPPTRLSCSWTRKVHTHATQTLKKMSLWWNCPVRHFNSALDRSLRSVQQAQMGPGMTKMQGCGKVTKPWILNALEGVGLANTPPHKQERRHQLHSALGRSKAGEPPEGHLAEWNKTTDASKQHRACAIASLAGSTSLKISFNISHACRLLPCTFQTSQPCSPQVCNLGIQCGWWFAAPQALCTFYA